jgi:hypothetical protein
VTVVTLRADEGWSGWVLVMAVALTCEPGFALAAVAGDGRIPASAQFQPFASMAILDRSRDD